MKLELVMTFKELFRSFQGDIVQEVSQRRIKEADVMIELGVGVS